MDASALLARFDQIDAALSEVSATQKHLVAALQHIQQHQHIPSSLPAPTVVADQRHQTHPLSTAGSLHLGLPTVPVRRRSDRRAGQMQRRSFLSQGSAAPPTDTIRIPSEQGHPLSGDLPVSATNTPPCSTPNGTNVRNPFSSPQDSGASTSSNLISVPLPTTQSVVGRKSALKKPMSNGDSDGTPGAQSPPDPLRSPSDATGLKSRRRSTSPSSSEPQFSNDNIRKPSQASQAFELESRKASQFSGMYENTVDSTRRQSNLSLVSEVQRRGGNCAPIPRSYRKESRIACNTFVDRIGRGPLITDMLSIASGSAEQAPDAEPKTDGEDHNSPLDKSEASLNRSSRRHRSVGWTKGEAEGTTAAVPHTFKRYVSNSTLRSRGGATVTSSNEMIESSALFLNNPTMKQLETDSSDSDDLLNFGRHLESSTSQSPNRAPREGSKAMRAANKQKLIHATNTSWLRKSLGSDSALVTIIDVLYLILSTIVVMLSVAALAFVETDPYPADTIVIEIVCSILTIIFAIAKSRTRVRRSEWEVEDDLGFLWKRYLCSPWFPIDIITIVPVELIFLNWSAFGFALCLMRHVCRLPRMFTLHTSSHPLVKSRGWFAVAFICAVAVVVCEGFAVAFSRLEDEPATGDSMTHLNAIYWTVTTMTSVGYGDIVPTTNQAKHLTIYLQIAGVLVVATVTSLGTKFLTAKDPLKDDLNRRKQQLYSMLQHYDVPWEVQKEVMAVYPAVLLEANEKQFQGLICALPSAVRAKLDYFQRVNLIKRVPLFGDINDHVLHLEIAGSLESTAYKEGEYVFQTGSAGDEMFFVLSGTVEVLQIVDNGEYEQVLAVLGAGQWFGEAALTEHTIRSVDVQAAEDCELLVLTRAAFTAIADQHESLSEVLETEAKALAKAYELEHARKMRRSRVAVNNEDDFYEPEDMHRAFSVVGKGQVFTDIAREDANGP